MTVRRDVSIEWHPGQFVTGSLAGPPGSLPPVLLAHGAGAGQDHPGVGGLRDRLADRGLRVLTFNYPYMEAGRRRPDHQGKLLDCHRAAVEWLENETGSDRVVLAGRSMGGRMGTYVATERTDVAGVILFAYPLHPTGKPERLRIDHLPDIRVPMLFFSGTRDSMAREELIARHLRPLPGATIEMIEGADHSFRVPRRTGRTSDDVLDQVADRTVEWFEDSVRTSGLPPAP